MIKNKWKQLTKKQKVLIIIVAVICLSFLASSSNSNTTNTKQEQNHDDKEIVNEESQNQTTEPVAVTYTLEQKQSDYIKFANNYIEINNTTEAIYSDLEKGLNGVASGDIDLLTFYETLPLISEKIRNQSQEMRNLQIPESLNEYNSDLKSIINDTASGYNYLSLAVGNIKDYVNKNNIEKLSIAKENMGSGRYEIQQSALKLLEVATKLNVNLDELEISQ